MDQEWEAVVVGGGMAGLSAAWELARAGLRPLLVEARGYTGGLVAGATIAGVRMDLGADGFAARDRGRARPAGGAGPGAAWPGPADLMAALGLATAAPQGRAGLFLPLAPDAPGEPVPGAGAWGARPLPAGSFLGIPADPRSPEVVAVIGAAAAASAAARDRGLPGAAGTGPREAGDLASFVRTRMGAVVLERLVRPVVAGIHSADPGTLAVDAVIPGLRGSTARLGSLGAAVAELLQQRRTGGLRSGDLGVEGGLVLAAEAMHRQIEQAGGRVLTRTGAQWLAQEAPGRWRLGIAATGRGPTPSAEPVAVGAPWQVSTARVVLACSPEPALRLLSGAPGVDTSLALPAGSPIARLIMVVRAPGLDGCPVGSGLLVAPAGGPGDGGRARDDGEGPCPVGAKALSHLSVKWPWIGRALAERHGPGVHALRLSYGRPWQPRPRVDLERALRDAAILTGAEIPPSAVIDHMLARWDGALAPATPAHRERVARLEARLDRIRGLAVTGAWVAGSGVAATVAHARGTARGMREAP